MKCILMIILSCACFCASSAQSFSGEYTAEWQWDMKKETNWVNLLRLNLSVPLFDGKGSLEAATIHSAKTNNRIIDDWQTFSNIEEDNQCAAIAVLGYMHQWKSAHLFLGVRNVNEDFFASDVTSLFTNSSCGIFPTISASYPIANYPFSGLTVYFDVSRGGWTFKNSIYNGVGYNGWKHHDNPFLVRPEKDGVFNMSQLEYSDGGGCYYAGVAVHTHRFPIDEEGEMVTADESVSKATCAWWVYGEQLVWYADEKSLFCMAQYSENTCHKNGCYRYAEVGCAYRDDSNECGFTGQYARFFQGTEYSVEVTWKRRINRSFSVQPAFQYITNAGGDYAVLMARLYCSF